MKYKDGYKYQLAVKETFYRTGVMPLDTIVTRFIMLTAEGNLVINPGYAWDGASGPTWDSKSSMRGSLAHDALYQLMREEMLDRKWRIEADRFLDDVLKEDGMWWPRRTAWIKALNWFGGPAADPGNMKSVLVAP